MGTHKRTNDLDWQSLQVVSRTISTFRVRQPSDVEEISSVDKLIKYISSEREMPQDAEVTVTVERSFEELQQAAFQRLKGGLLGIGASLPESLHSSVSPDKLLPIRNRHVNWKDLAQELRCELPGLATPKWAFWLSLLLTYPFVCVVMVLLLAPLFAFLGIDEDPPWFVMVTLGPMIFFSCILLATVAASKAEGFLFSNPTRVPFDSIREFTLHVASHAHGIEDSLARSFSTTIEQYVREVVAEEFRITPNQISDGFPLIRG